MSIFAYLRVSSQQQVLDRQEMEIQKFAKQENIVIDKVYEEKYTGTKKDRPVFSVLMNDVLRSGDILIIQALDRLSRSKADIKDIMYQFNKKGIRLVICNLPTTHRLLKDTGDSQIESLLYDTISSILLEVLAFFSEEEVRSKKERQQQGYEALRASGKWNEVIGRPKVVKQDVFNRFYKQKVLSGKMKVNEGMKALNVSVATWYRLKKQYDLVYKDEGEKINE